MCITANWHFHLVLHYQATNEIIDKVGNLAFFIPFGQAPPPPPPPQTSHPQTFVVVFCVLFVSHSWSLFHDKFIFDTCTLFHKKAEFSITVKVLGEVSQSEAFWDTVRHTAVKWFKVAKKAKKPIRKTDTQKDVKSDSGCRTNTILHMSSCGILFYIHFFSELKMTGFCLWFNFWREKKII